MSSLLLPFSSQALAGDGRMFSRAVSLLNIQPMLRLDYTATDASADQLAPHQASLDELGVSAGQWNPLGGPAPGNMGGADLVMCNCATGPLPNPAEALGNLVSGVKEGGFVLLHTLLKGDTLGETVAFLTTQNHQQDLLSQVRNPSPRSLCPLFCV